MHMICVLRLYSFNTLKILFIKVLILKKNHLMYHFISPDLDLDAITVFEIINPKHKKATKLKILKHDTQKIVLF